MGRSPGPHNGQQGNSHLGGLSLLRVFLCTVFNEAPVSCALLVIHDLFLVGFYVGGGAG